MRNYLSDEAPFGISAGFGLTQSSVHANVVYDEGD